MRVGVKRGEFGEKREKGSAWEFGGEVGRVGRGS